MLEDVRVVDLGAFITAPLAGMMLGDLGADVVKLEPPDGDPFRRGHGGSYGSTFIAYNRNKRSVALDLATAEGRGKLEKLVARADVLIDNFRPGVLEKLGLEPKALGARHSRLIHCSITGFGTTGPARDRPAFDAVGMAVSGFSSLLVDPENPQLFGPSMADNVTGMYACTGILAALAERARTGRGRRIEVNMLEATMSFIQDAYTNYTREGAIGGRFTRVNRSQSFAVRCGDGKLLAFQLSTREKFWQELLAAMEETGLGADPRFAKHQARVAHYHELQAELGRRFQARPRAEWMARLAARDVPFAPIHNLAEALADPQAQALGVAFEQTHPKEGRVVTIACPLRVDGARLTGRGRAPPQIGEHNAEVFAEWDEA